MRIRDFNRTLPVAVAELERLWNSAWQLMPAELLNQFEPDANAITSAITRLGDLQSELLANTRLQDLFTSPDPSRSLAKVRHDLRTPMIPVKGYTEMILDDLPDQSDDALRLGFQAVIEQITSVLAAIELLQDSDDTEPGQQQNHTVGKNAPAEHSSRTGGPTGRILIIDDISANREVLRRGLLAQGHEVVDAESGTVALQLMHTQKFDLILLDILMPEMDGYEVLGRMKSDGRLRHLPVIVISALDEMASVVKCIEAGAEDYLSKPFDPTLLRARIGNCLEKKRLRDETDNLLNRLEEEMEDARRAQLSMVPGNFHEQSLRAPVKVHASMQPAREVGGDFYDFFYTGGDNFWFLVGDVSDKGVASGMFMAKTVALVRSIPRQVFQQSGRVLLPHELLQTLNCELCELNEEMTFVTIAIACLDARSGTLWLANAGHADALCIGSEGGVKAICVKRGRPLGIRDDSLYETSVFCLDPGDTVFIYTDGVTDASNAASAFFGDSRLFEVLSQQSAKSPEEIVNKVEAAVSRFVECEDQFDDITLLGVRWAVNEEGLKVLEMTNHIDNVGRICTQSMSYFEQNGLSKSVVKDLVIVIDEVLSNTVNYGYSGDQAGQIFIRIIIDSDLVSMQFEDDAVSFNPLEQKTATPSSCSPGRDGASTDIDNKEVGGLGIRFLKSLVDDANYQRRANKNVLTVLKRLQT